MKYSAAIPVGTSLTGQLFCPKLPSCYDNEDYCTTEAS
jgi:hypothetical protein